MSGESLKIKGFLRGDMFFVEGLKILSVIFS